MIQLNIYNSFIIHEISSLHAALIAAPNLFLFASSLSLILSLPCCHHHFQPLSQLLGAKLDPLSYFAAERTSSGRSVPSDPRRCRRSSAFPDSSRSSSALLSASAFSTWLRLLFFFAAAALPRRAITPEAASAARLALTSSRFTSSSRPTCYTFFHKVKNI